MKTYDVLAACGMALALVCPGEFTPAATLEIGGITVPPPRLTIRSDLGATNVIEYTKVLATNQWQVLTNLVVTNSPYVVEDLTGAAAQRFYRVVIPAITNVPAGMVLVPAGSFTMGDPFNDSQDSWGEHPTHTVQVSGFYMDMYEVRKDLWDEVKTWAVAHGYGFDNPGLGRAANHPVHSVSWYDAVKWCNARSEKEGRVPAYYTDVTQNTVYRTGQIMVQNSWVKWDRGYRLPTEAEWEKAARGGANRHRFPWTNGDTITHDQANYYSTNTYAYDLSATRGYHPSYQAGAFPYTSPVGSFAPNGYGLYDMAGNLMEWCWDLWGTYSSGTQSDPRGPASGSFRVHRGGSWSLAAFYCRVAYRNRWVPSAAYNYAGFRTVLPPAP